MATPLISVWQFWSFWVPRFVLSVEAESCCSAAGNMGGTSNPGEGKSKYVGHEKRGNMSKNTEGENEAKKPRIDPGKYAVDLEDVTLHILRTGENSEESDRCFVSKSEHTQSLQKVKEKIEGDDHLLVTKEYRLYPAFKEALLRIVKAVEDVKKERNRARIILVHGMPNLGKSALAECLAYYLALAEGDVHLMKLVRCETYDPEALTDSITDVLCSKSLILDQVNTGSLLLGNIRDTINSKFRRLSGQVPLPLIAFTSGHYAPQADWLDFQSEGWLCYKVIHMRIDEALVSEMRERSDTLRDCPLSNDDLLGVTNIFWRMDQCLRYIAPHNPGATVDEIRQFIYPPAEIQEPTVHLFWLVWEEFLIKGLPDREDFGDEHCKIRPVYIEYLSFLISRFRDPNDGSINSTLNSTDVVGSSAYTNNNYTEYKPDDYYYQFLNKDDLYDTLKQVIKFRDKHTPQQNVNLISKALNFLRESNDSQMFKFISRGLFELFIKLHCECEGKRKGCSVGMTVLGSTVDFVTVNHVVDVATEEELCNLPNQYETCKTENTAFWCILNAPGRPAFKGYDYAYIITMPKDNKPVVDKVELFHVTVKPHGQKRDERQIMTDVLTSIKRTLTRMDLVQSKDADDIVVPYFLHHREKSSTLELPFRDSSRKMKVELLCFPQELFVVKNE